METATRQDYSNLVSRLQKALSLNHNPSFVTIAHDCGFKVGIVHELVQNKLIVKVGNGWRWSGPFKLKDAVDKLIVMKRNYAEEQPTFESRVQQMHIHGITISVKINCY